MDSNQVCSNQEPMSAKLPAIGSLLAEAPYISWFAFVWERLFLIFLCHCATTVEESESRNCAAVIANSYLYIHKEKITYPKNISSVCIYIYTVYIYIYIRNLVGLTGHLGLEAFLFDTDVLGRLQWQAMQISPGA